MENGKRVTRRVETSFDKDGNKVSSVTETRDDGRGNKNTSSYQLEGDMDEQAAYLEDWSGIQAQGGKKNKRRPGRRKY